jgi:hypothetical protein
VIAVARYPADSGLGGVKVNVNAASVGVVGHRTYRLCRGVGCTDGLLISGEGDAEEFFGNTAGFDQFVHAAGWHGA